MILFSIIIPAYNVENYIKNTLNSVCENQLEQTEIIVIDDGSKDNTLHEIEECLKNNNPPHYKIIAQENQGVSVARNQGIEQASGKFLIFCDGDDLCKPNMIETLSNYTMQDWDMLVWRYDITQEGEKTQISQREFGESVLYQPQIFGSFLFGGNRIRLGSFAIRSEFLKTTGIKYTVGCALSQDVEFIYKCLSEAKKVVLMNDILFTYAKRSGSVMYKYNMNRFEAPRVVMRIGAYVRKHTNLTENQDINDYLSNGYLIQHSVFAFDSCISHLNRSNLKSFWEQYTEKYSDVETAIKRAAKDMKRYPVVLPRKRTKLFCLNRKLYVCVMLLYHKWKKVK